MPVARKATDPRRKLTQLYRKQKRLFLLAIAAIIAVSAIAVGQILPKNIALTVNIEATYGGVFADDASCEIGSDFVQKLKTITVSPSNGESLQIPLEGLSLSGKNTCTFSSVISLPPGQTYTVNIGEYALGQIGAVAFQNEAVELLLPIKVTKVLTGIVRLTQPTGCYRVGDTFYCSGIELSESGGGCGGYGAYSDLAGGTTIKIYSSDGELIGQGNLEVGQWSYPDGTRQIGNQNRIRCEMAWTIRDVPFDVKGYSVELTERRGKVFFTADESDRSMVLGWN